MASDPEPPEPQIAPFVKPWETIGVWLDADVWRDGERWRASARTKTDRYGGSFASWDLSARSLERLKARANRRFRSHVRRAYRRQAHRVDPPLWVFHQTEAQG